MAIRSHQAYLVRLDEPSQGRIHTLRVPVPSGVFPRQARALFSASPYLRLYSFSPGSSTYEGEAVDTVTPTGLPQEPSPYEEDKHRYATSMSVSSGPWRWIPLGVVGHFVFSFVVHFLLLFLFVVFFVYDGYASS